MSPKGRKTRRTELAKPAAGEIVVLYRYIMLGFLMGSLLRYVLYGDIPIFFDEELILA